MLTVQCMLDPSCLARFSCVIEGIYLKDLRLYSVPGLANSSKLFHEIRVEDLEAT